MNEKEISMYLYHYFNNLEIELDTLILNRLTLINRSQLHTDDSQLEELRDLFIKKAFLKQISTRVYEIFRWCSLL